MNPNFLYYAAIFLWPLVAIYIFRKYEVEKSVVLLILIPYLFLPTDPLGTAVIPFPLITALDKTVVPPLVLFLLLYFSKNRLTVLPSETSFKILLTFLFVASVGTVLTNPDPLYFGSKTISGMGKLQIANKFVETFLSVYLPFMVGYSFLRNESSLEGLLKYLFIFGLIYSALMLYELRFSPQLHVDVYGYFPHDWTQVKRSGGFRPVIFLGHGLLVALFAFYFFISAFYNRKTQAWTKKQVSLILLIYATALIVLCKTYSILFYALIFFLVGILFKKQKTRITLLILPGILLLSYPFVRPMLPLDSVVEQIASLNEERSRSFEFRVINEEMLIEKAKERPMLGWGGWGRNRVYDPYSGEDLSVTDGSWIIVYGEHGIIGYIGLFGLLLLSLFKARAATENTDSDHFKWSLYCGSTLVAMTMLDQIPNASLNTLTFLIAGALAGSASELQKSSKLSKSKTLAR